jgi:hypothetical protein
MAKDSDVRLPHRLVVPIRDTPHAPIIFLNGPPCRGMQTESSASHLVPLALRYDRTVNYTKRLSPPLT